MALKISPKSIEIIINLASAYLVNGNFLSAEKQYLKVVKINKFEPRGYYGLYSIDERYILKYSKDIKLGKFPSSKNFLNGSKRR